MAARKPYPVEVHWIDSCGHPGWRGEDEPSGDQVSRCMSTGYLLVKSQTEITLAQSLGDNSSTASWITIPLVAVKRVRRLK